MTGAGGNPQPAIPVGWATYLGTAGAGAAAATPLVQWIAGLDTSHAGLYLTIAGALTAVTQLGRYAQATWGRSPRAGALSSPTPGETAASREGGSPSPI